MGGIQAFYNLSNLSPHNLLLDAWIRGGIFGFISIFILVIIVFKKGYIILRNSTQSNPILLFFTMSLLNLIIMSFTHNEGLTSSDGITFIVFSFFILALKYRTNFKGII